MSTDKRGNPQCGFYVVHDGGWYDFDSGITKQAIEIIVYVIRIVPEPVTITKVSKYLNIPRGRLSRLIKALGLDFDELRKQLRDSA
jgi:hypothetical protein